MTRIQKVVAIINPVSGIDTPVLAHLSRAFKQFDIEWEVQITKKRGEAKELVQKALALNPDAVAVYGGDGTLLEVAGQLFTTDVPLVALPGGSANILIKELGIPLELNAALQIFGREVQIKELDVFEGHDGTPLFLRKEVGILADMVRSARRKYKNMIGGLTYPMAAVEHLISAQAVSYTITVDGQTCTTSGVGLMVANVGNIGLPGISIQPEVSPFDGKLDVFVLQTNDILTLLSLGGNIMGILDKPSMLQHWQGTSVSVKIEPKQTVVRDDQIVDTDYVEARLSTRKLKVAV